MNRCSTASTVRKMQIKTTERYQFIFVRKSTLKKKSDKHDGKNVEKSETLYTIDGNIHINIVENSMETPRETKNKTSI